MNLAGYPSYRDEVRAFTAMLRSIAGPGTLAASTVPETIPPPPACEDRARVRRGAASRGDDADSGPADQRAQVTTGGR